MTGASMPIWGQIILSIIGPLMSGLMVAGVVGVFRLLSEFRALATRMGSFETLVRDELKINRQQHEQIRRNIDEHMAEEMGIIRRLRPDNGATV